MHDVIVALAFLGMLVLPSVFAMHSSGKSEELNS